MRTRRMCVGAAVVFNSVVFAKLIGDEVVDEMLEIVSLVSIVVTFGDGDDGMTTDKDQAVPEGLRCVEKIKFFFILTHRKTTIDCRKTKTDD